MRISALHSVDWPAVSAEKTEPAPGVEREAAETEKPAEIISAAVQICGRKRRGAPAGRAEKE